MEEVTDFLFLGSKITVDGDCSHEIRRQLLPGRKVMTNLDSVLKIRGITVPTQVPIVKAIEPEDTSFKHHQLRTMRSYFTVNHNPDPKDLEQLAQKKGLTKRVLSGF